MLGLLFALVNTAAASASQALDVASPYHYNESMAKLMVRYAGIAYCGRGRVEKWDCPECKKLPYLNATYIFEVALNVHAYVGYDKSINTIYAVFTGTDPINIRNWIEDIDFIPLPVPCPVHYGICLMHMGFHDDYLSIRPRVHNAILYWKNLHPTAKVRVTGHSLGAALSIIALDDIYHKLNITTEAFYNFGAPRVGNGAWHRYFMDTVGKNIATWRVTHAHDPVPHLPFQFMDFHHNPVEVFYDEKQTTYVVCNDNGEDYHCSNKYPTDLNALDHLNYLGFDFTTNYLGCKL